MIIVYQGGRRMIASPGVTIGISDEANRLLQEHQIKLALEKNDTATYNLLTANEADAAAIQIPVYDLDEDEEVE